MRYSPQRKTILNILKKAKDHPSADIILNRSRKEIPNISLGTVYRNLKQLEESKLISSYIFAGSHHYDGNLDPHHHFYCVKCSSIIDLPIEDPKFNNVLIEKFELSVERVELSLTGLCSECKPKTGE